MSIRNIKNKKTSPYTMLLIHLKLSPLRNTVSHCLLYAFFALEFQYKALSCFSSSLSGGSQIFAASSCSLLPPLFFKVRAVLSSSLLTHGFSVDTYSSRAIILKCLSILLKARIDSGIWGLKLIKHGSLKTNSNNKKQNSNKKRFVFRS